MSSIYKKDFIFQATSYEEYKGGIKTASGTTSALIYAKVIDPETLGIAIRGSVPVNINDNFGLPIFGAYNGDVLEDRVQYGRLPDRLSWDDPAEPIVCEIFNTMRCIRFAMLSPLRIVEFSGQFIEIQ